MGFYSASKTTSKHFETNHIHRYRLCCCRSIPRTRYANPLTALHDRHRSIPFQEGLGLRYPIGCEVIISSSQQSRIDDAVKRLQQAYPSSKDKISGYACGLGDEATLEKNVESLYASATSNGSKKLDHVIFTAYVQTPRRYSTPSVNLPFQAAL